MWSKYLLPIYRQLSVRNRSLLLAYILAISNSFFILLVHNQLTHILWNASPFLMFLPGVILTSWYGGFLPGLVATAVATIVGDYFFLNPLYTFTIAHSSDIARLSLFSTVGVLISVINQSFYNQKEEKDRLLKQLELSEKRFKQIADTSPVMIWMVNQTLHTIFTSSAFQNYFGNYNSDRMILDNVHPDERDEAEATISKAIREKRKFQCECRLKGKQGSYHWMLVTGIPHVVGGQFLGFLGTCIDIHEQKMLDEQKTSFLTMVAHELRTPLATAQLINELLINKFNNLHDKKDVEDLENMHEELESLSNLMQELLQFVRGEQGKLSLHKTDISLTHLIQRAIDNYQKSYPEISFKTYLTKDYTLHADGKRLKQVLYNLLDNAVKASPPHGTITITTTQNEKTIVTSVTDEGNGISSQEQKNIFKQYYQAKNAKGYGFGLGLYISKQIIEKHQGQMWAESTVKKGSTFFFSLPK